jgi:NtrC-family two-component system sensor histidine kinase KinB
MSIALLLEHTEMKLGENDLELLKTAQEEVNRLKALVNDLLDLSKIEMGRIHIEFEEIPVYPLAEQVQTVFKSQMEEKSVSLKIKMEKNLPKINADPNKIIWVMTNLISNALRYVKAGGQIEIRAEKEESKVRFSVIDDGPGIPPEYHSKIFQKFVKVEGREEGGTGLGLAICKEIVNAHGGTIWVESVRGEGSTFIFTLPAVL